MHLLSLSSILHPALDAAMSISGGLDMRQQINARRSMRLWQPMLTFGLREDFILGKYGLHYKSRLGREQFLGLLRATSISVRWNKLSSRLLIDGIKLPIFVPHSM